jgi:hypothetical protein
MKEVNYEDSYKELNTIEEILTHKAKAWEYEQECRYLSKDNKKCEPKIEIKKCKECKTEIDIGEKCEPKIKIGKITKIYFGAPYEELENIDEIKKIHKKLKKYLGLKEKLKKYLKKHNSGTACKKNNAKITCEDYYFNKPTKK